MLSGVLGQPRQPQSLGLVHAVNCMAFAGNSFCVYAATVGLFGMSNKDVSALYPTLVTPAFWGFLIWPVIFGLQGCFTLLQLLPQYREEPMSRRAAGGPAERSC